MSLQNISFDEPKNQRRRRRSTKRIIQTIKPSCAPDFTKRPAAYPASSGFLNGPSCKYMKKPIAAPHSPPTLQKSMSSLPNFQAGAIIFLTCIATASVLEMLVRGAVGNRRKIFELACWDAWIVNLRPSNTKLTSKCKFHCMEPADVAVPLDCHLLVQCYGNSKYF